MARRFVKHSLFVGIPVAAIAALVAFWNWDWLIPIVQGRASSVLGRQVMITHLHVRLGRVTTVDADDVRITNPALREAVVAKTMIVLPSKLSYQSDLMREPCA